MDLNLCGIIQPDSHKIKIESLPGTDRSEGHNSRHWKSWTQLLKVTTARRKSGIFSIVAGIQCRDAVYAWSRLRGSCYWLWDGLKSQRSAVRLLPGLCFRWWEGLWLGNVGLS